MADAYSKLHLDFTDDGTLKVVTEGTLSLQKTVRALRQELTLPIYSPEQRTQIRLALAEAEVGLQNTKVQSRELFSQLALIPGPIGNIAAQTQNVLMGMRALSQLSFKDLQAQFKILKESLFGSPAEISNAVNVIEDVVKKKSGAGGGPPTIGTIEPSNAKQDISVLTSLSTAIATGTVALKEYLISADKFGKVIAEQAAANLNLIDGYKAAAFAVKDAKGKITDYGVALSGAEQKTVTLTKAGILASAEIKTIKEVTDAAKLSTVGFNNEENAATKALYYNTIGLAENTAAKEANNVATEAGTKAVRGFGAYLGVAFLAVLAAVTAAVVKYKDYNDQLRISEEQLGKEIENTGKILDMDEKDFTRRTAKREAEMKASNKSEKDIRRENYEDARTNYNTITTALDEARKEQEKARAKIKESGDGGTGTLFVSAENLKKQEDNLNKANKSVEDLEEKQKNSLNQIYIKASGAKEEILRRGYQNDLRQLDSKIELEIKKENTSKNQLEQLLKDRNKLVDDYNVNIQLSDEDRELRKKNDNKKINDAIIDDTVRNLKKQQDVYKRAYEELDNGTELYFENKKNYISKQFEIEMEEAKKDEQTRVTNEKNARTKFYTSTLALDLEKAQFKVKVTQNQLNAEYLETQKYFKKQRDLLDAKYEADKLAAKNNYDVLLALDIEYQKNKKKIDGDEFAADSKFQQKVASTMLNFHQMNVYKMTEFDKMYYDTKQKSIEDDYKAGLSTTEEGSQQRLAVEADYKDKSVQLEQEKNNQKRAIASTEVEWALQIGNILVSLANTFASKNKDLQRLALTIQSAAQIAKIIIDANAGIAAATAAAAPFLANPITAVPAAAQLAAVTAGVKTSQYISIAAVLAATAAGFAQINGAGSGSGGSGGDGPDRINRGKNYGAGGYIDGPSHANGGVPATLEGGEAVMTRGAVTAFAPLLSLMNQAGGGTAFSQAAMGQAKFDNPRVTNNAVEPQIIKTYIVENELTSIQQRQARLKSLSTL